MSNPRASLNVDVAVIGAGTAGLAAYRAAAARTSRVVLIEAGAYGTTCARVGCMPSKLLIAAAEAAHDARSAAPFGVRAEVRIDGRAVMDRVRRERDRFVGFVVESSESIPEERRLRGHARYVAPGVLDVDGVRVEARAVVAATGSSPALPSMFDRVKGAVVLNDHVFAWEELPRSIAVFGAGVIGLELGQALHRLGVRTRILGRGGRVGPLTDPSVREAALAAFGEELELDVDADVRSVDPDSAGGVKVSFVDRAGASREERFDTLLVAAGRRPNIKGLDLARAGIPIDANGLPKVDRFTLQVGDAPLFVPGDANDENPLLHEAADEGRFAGENAARFPYVQPHPRRSLLVIAFTDPGLAIAGATYESLAARGALAVGEVRFENQGRSRVIRKNVGALRVYADPRSGRFLGAEMAGPRAEHLAHLLAWAHQQEMTIERMLAMPFYHPVVEEGLRTALKDVHAKLAA
jgi:dihydrolipoamide dehydrogenase